MKPEDKARLKIHQLLEAVGFRIRGARQICGCVSGRAPRTVIAKHYAGKG